MEVKNTITTVMYDMYYKFVSEPLGALLITLAGLVLTVWFLNLPLRLVRKENTNVVKEKPSDHCEKKNSFKEVAKKKQQDKHVNKVKKLSVEGTKGTGLDPKIPQVSAAIAAAAASAAARRSNMITQQTGED